MECEELADRLMELMDGEMSEADEAAALEHLATCPSCALVLEGTRATVHLVHEHGRVELEESDRQRMMDSIRRELGSDSSGDA